MFSSQLLNSPWTPPAARVCLWPKLYAMLRHPQCSSPMSSFFEVNWTSCTIPHAESWHSKANTLRLSHWVLYEAKHTPLWIPQTRVTESWARILVTFGKFSGHFLPFYFPHPYTTKRKWRDDLSLSALFHSSLPEKTNRNILWPSCWPTAQEQLKQAAAGVYFRMRYLNW